MHRLELRDVPLLDGEDEDRDPGPVPKPGQRPGQQGWYDEWTGGRVEDAVEWHVHEVEEVQQADPGDSGHQVNPAKYQFQHRVHDYVTLLSLFGVEPAVV